MQKSVALIITIILAVAGLAAYVVFGGNTANSPSTTNQATSGSPTNTDDQPDVTATPDTAEASVVITYSNSGFSPSGLKIKAGQTVEVKNTSSRPLDFDSDPHPAHTDNPELNAGLIQSGKSKKFTINKTGEWGYHNHLNSAESGSLTVE